MDVQNHPHKFVDTIIPPTCKEPGYTLHRCDCGYEYKDNFTPVGTHQYQVLERKNPTCTEGGMQRLRCAVCGKEEIRTAPAKVHSWGQWNVRVVPTCTQPGKQIRYCTACGTLEEQVVGATGHKLIPATKAKTKTGQKTYFCQNCGQTVEKESADRKWLIWLIAAVAALAVIALLVVFVLLPQLKKNKTSNKKIDDTATKTAQTVTAPSGTEESTAPTDGEKPGELQPPAEDPEEPADKKPEGKSLVICGKETAYDAAGNPVAKTLRQYDAANRTITETEYDATGEIVREHKYEYDEKGNEIHRTVYDAYGNVVDEYKYEYDAYGNPVRWTNLLVEGNKEPDTGSSDGDWTYETAATTESDTDSSDSLGGDWTYDESGVERAGAYKYKYDENGIVLQVDRVIYNASGNVIDACIYQYEYDAKGNMIRIVCSETTGEIVYENKLEYDVNGNEIRDTTYDADGYVMSEYKYEYDAHGNQVRMISRDAHGSVAHEYKYEYDANGNKLRKTEYTAAGNVIGRTEYADYQTIQFPAVIPAQ